MAHLRTREYQSSEKIAESSSTLVCRGRRLIADEPLILKFRKPHGVTGANLPGFRCEYELISRIDLPCVVKTYALEEHQGGLLMVMEDIGGESLDRLLMQGPISHTTFLELAIILGVCRI